MAKTTKPAKKKTSNSGKKSVVGKKKIPALKKVAAKKKTAPAKRSKPIATPKKTAAKIKAPAKKVVVSKPAPKKKSSVLSKSEVKPIMKTVAAKAPEKVDVPPRKVKPKKLDPALIDIRNRLIRERQEVLKILQTSKEMERNVSELNFSNEIDLASSLEGREMAFTLSSRDRNELRLIDEALFRISAGTYGTCETCAKIISVKRLQIMPLTALCIDCQSMMEEDVDQPQQA